MKGLYRGRYLVAIYDKNDNLIEVAENPTQMKNATISAISHMKERGSINSKIYLIDCTQEQNDIFQEEDKIFLDFIREEQENKEKQTYTYQVRELMKKYGISERTACRRYAEMKKRGVICYQ